jgi:hypothetical protein
MSVLFMHNLFNNNMNNRWAQLCGVWEILTRERIVTGAVLSVQQVLTREGERKGGIDREMDG